MKRTTYTLDLGKYRKILQNIGFVTKIFVVLSLVTFLFFIVIGFIGYGQTKLKASPISSMRGLAASVSNEFFSDMLGLEVPHLSEQKSVSTFSQKNIFGFVFRLLTDINPRDPKTLIAREVPGMASDSAILLHKGLGTDPAAGPLDYTPANHSDPGGNNGNNGNPQNNNSGSAAPSPSPDPSQARPPANGKKLVMIYHSHNRESWVPELGLDPKKADSAFDTKTNVTMVGKRMADKLNEIGIGAVNYNTDYQSTEKDFNYYFSYKYSGRTVKEAFAVHPELTYLFDIHRDSSSRDKTTITINGKDYAQLYFVVGQKNPNWEKNEQFASQIQERLEKKLPGISRGIWSKKARDGNAEYNQSLSPNSILIEIGGVFNTLEETYRTSDVLSEVIGEIVMDAKKVDGSKPGETGKN